MSNFFRLNVDKLLTKLPRPVTFNESQQAMIQGLNENRFFVHIAARRTGKSYAAAILAFAKLLEPGQQVMVVAPNFSLLLLSGTMLPISSSNLRLRLIDLTKKTR